MKTHIVYGDVHTLPGKDNNRATWLSNLISDVKPDVVVNLGDNADMESLCSYDKGKFGFIGRTYAKDIEIHLDFEEKLWGPIKKKKKKLPRRTFIVGNHEHRISRALQTQPEFMRTIGLKDLRLEDYYDDIIDYTGGTPGSICIDGVTYSHYFVTGVSGKPSSTINPASSALLKTLRSVTQGHAHVFDFCSKPTIDSQRLNSLVAGCFVDHPLTWAGEVNKIWFRGCFIKRFVENGNYDLEVVSIERLKKEYNK